MTRPTPLRAVLLVTGPQDVRAELVRQDLLQGPASYAECDVAPRYSTLWTDGARTGMQ